MKFIENEKYDFTEYFKNVIGVTVYKDRTAEEILLEVDKDLYPYVSSKPMHASQELIRYTEDGNAIVSLFVIPNFELKQQILSYGKRMKVVSPLHLQEAIIQNLKENLESYESAHMG